MGNRRPEVLCSPAHTCKDSYLDDECSPKVTSAFSSGLWLDKLILSPSLKIIVEPTVEIWNLHTVRHPVAKGVEFLKRRSYGLKPA
jgi:hypothetical protein